MLKKSISVEEARAILTQIADQRLKNNLQTTAATAFGGGLLAGSGLGIAKLLKQNLVKRPTFYSAPLVPVNVKPEVKRKRRKEAATADMVPFKLLSDVLQGRTAKSPITDPRLMAIGMPLAMASFYAGWTPAKYIIDKERKKRVQDELEQAKQEFDAALMPSDSKQSSSLGKKLEAIYNMTPRQLYKISSLSEPVTSFLGGAGSAAVAAQTFLALAAGVGTYKLMRPENETMLASEQQLRNAISRRQRETGAPNAVYAFPVVGKDVAEDMVENEDIPMV